MRRTRATSLADQVLANASNALFTFLVAGAASPAAFGRFAVGYAVLAFGVSAWRTGLSYQISMKAGDPAAVRDESRSAVAASLIAAPFPALLVLVVTGTGPLTDPALAWGLAIATPFVLTQDLLRYAAVAANRARAALISDSVWTALLGAAVLLRVLERLDTATLVALWTGGAAVATLLLLWALRLMPRFTGVRSWISESWKGRSHLLGGGLIAGASVPVTSALVAVIASPEVVGAFTGAGQLMAPVNSLLAWLSLTLLAHGAAAEPSRKVRVFAKTGGIAAGLTLAWSLMLILLPEPIGTALLGETWVNVVPVLPIAAAQYTISVLAGTGDLLLMSMGRTRQVLNNGLVVAGARIGLSCAGAALFGTAIARSLAEALTMVAWLGSVARYLARPHRRPAVT